MRNDQSTRRDDQASDSLSYVGPNGALVPLEGGEAGPRFVPAVERGAATLYTVVRKGLIDDYTTWRIGQYLPCDEVQVPGEAYDIGDAIDVSEVGTILWILNYVPPNVEDEAVRMSYVLSTIMEVSNNGSRWVPYTLLDNAFSQLNLSGDSSQPEPVGVGTVYATRSVYASEIRSPNMLAGDTPEPPYNIERRIDQPVFEVDASAPPNPPAAEPQVFPIGFHFTYDVAPFTHVRLRWKHIRVDAAGTFVAAGAASSVDPRDPALNGYVTINYVLLNG